ncbi:MAG: tyrosine-type recombinase/integrase [Desulfobacterales bacterium]|nr:tyrosine-type recombinase/integrase [Desulfobacterales bacterium]
MRIKELIPIYLRYMKVIGKADLTIRVARYDLYAFAVFLEKEGILDIEDLTGEAVSIYQEELSFQLTNKGKLLHIGTQLKILCMIKGFTRFLKEQEYLINDVSYRIKLPKTPKRLPKVILSDKEIKHLMESFDMRSYTGYRNRIMVEILYDTGIRRAELANIKLSDMDLKSGYTRIEGKGKKERVVPISARVCKMVNNYIMMVRPEFISGDDPCYLLLNRFGEKILANTIWIIIKRCVSAAGLKKNVNVHTFRHTCATHMLKNGAPIRHLQEMLGHESLESTQIYTQVTINDLKEIHDKYHPSQKLRDKSE